MTTQALPAPTSAAPGRGKAPPLTSSNRPRITEREMAFAVADWFAGAPWPFDDAEWFEKSRRAVRLQQQGDALVFGEEIIARRRPASVNPRQGGRAHLSEARAVCRVALRGDHLTLYRQKDAPARLLAA